ncbi:MAG: hypothetical protein AAGJ87_01105 [Pseudomonadota bacterium]
MTAWTAGTLEARGEIIVTPLRQVITGEHREAVYEVSNPSSRTLMAEISWIDLKARESGYEPGDPDFRARMSAAPYLIVQPTYFHLEPGARREVAVSLKNGAAPPRGERRSHLLIETRAARTPLRKAGGMQLDIDLGLSTPVILRDRQRAAKAQFGDTRLTRSADGFLVLETFVRAAGDISAYGRVVASLQKHGEPTSVDIGQAENISAFIDADRRRVSVPLGYEHLPAGVLSMRFEGAAEFSGVVFDTRAFDVGPPSSSPKRER